MRIFNERKHPCNECVGVLCIIPYENHVAENLLCRNMEAIPLPARQDNNLFVSVLIASEHRFRGFFYAGYGLE